MAWLDEGGMQGSNVAKIMNALRLRNDHLGRGGAWEAFLSAAAHTALFQTKMRGGCYTYGIRTTEHQAIFLSSRSSASSCCNLLSLRGPLYLPPAAP